MKKSNLTYKYRLLLFLLGLVIISFGFIEGDKTGKKSSSKIYKVTNTTDEGGKKGDAYRLYVNNINLPLNRSGKLADVNIPPDGTLGRFDESSFLFSGGFMLSGYAGPTLFANAVASASLVEDYGPGIVGSQTNAEIYVVKRNDVPGGIAYQDWADAVALGADYYDVNNNNQYDPDVDIPDILGDETVWCVYNDNVPSAGRRWNAVSPVGIEVRQTAFALNSKGPVGNIIFLRYRLKYVGTNRPGEPDKLTDVYFGTWDDPDIGSEDYQTDLVGSDVPRNAIFTYKGETGPNYGNNPPSFFATFFSGPVEYIPGETFIDNNGDGEYTEGTDTPLDTAYSVRGRNIGIIEYPGARNQPLSSVIEYFNGFSDPDLNDPNTHIQARNYMLGLKSNGEEVDPCNFSVGEVRGGVDCNTVNPRFFFSGDPVTDVGWIGTQPWDVRQMANTGPFTLYKDTQENREAGRLIEKEIIVAYVVGRGTDAINSITVAREINDISQRIFDNNFPSPPPPPSIAYEVKTGSDFIDLTWLTAADGPLPIGQNPGDLLRYRGEDTVLNVNRWVQGFYVNAFRTRTSTATVAGENNILELQNYSLTNGVDTIRNIYYEASNGGIVLRRAVAPDGYILDSTLYADPEKGRVRLRITEDPFTEGPLIKGKEYYFGITQYTLNHNAIENIETGERSGSGDYLEASAYEEFNLLSPLQEIYQGQSLIITVVFGEDLYNPAIPVQNLQLENHIAGASTGIIGYDVVSNAALTDDLYEVTFFKDSASSLYDMYWRLTDASTNTLLIDSSKSFTYGESSLAEKVADGFILRVDSVVATIAYPEYDPANAVWYDTLLMNRNGTGVFYVGDDLEDNGINVGRPPYLSTGPRCDQIEASDLRRIELRFGQQGDGKAYRYINGYKGGVFQSANSYSYAAGITPSDTVGRGTIGNWDTQNDRPNGWVDVPFTAWLVDPNFSSSETQLAVGFLEKRSTRTQGGVTIVEGGIPDGVWDPTDSIANTLEYIFIFNSPYDQNGGQIEYTGGVFNTQAGDTTVWSDLLKASASFRKPIPSNATGVTQEQRDIFISSYFNTMYIVGLQKKYMSSNFSPGDKFIITLDEYPYTENDVYQFSPGKTITADQQRDLWDKVNVFPNPLYGFNPATSYNNSPADEPFVTFSNLPEEVTIKIYTLSGTLIRTLYTEDKSNPTSPFLPWDLQNESGLRVASGLYIAIISNPVYGDKILKFSIIMPQKQLQRY